MGGRGNSVGREIFVLWLQNHISEPENAGDFSFGENHIVSRL